MYYIPPQCFILLTYSITVVSMYFLIMENSVDSDQIALSEAILGNPGVTHSVSTAFLMNAVGTEWVIPGLPWVSEAIWSGSSVFKNG